MPRRILRAHKPRLIPLRRTSPSPAPVVRPPCWDSDEDYDSDFCVSLGWPLDERGRSKLLSAIHGAWVDLADDDFYWPHDPDYDISTSEPTLEGLGSFLVEAEEAIAWFTEGTSSANGTVERLIAVYHGLRKEDRAIGDRALLELRIICRTYVNVYTERDECKAQLPAMYVVRKVRSVSADAVQTETTTGEALVQRVCALKASVDTALEACGETLF